jgi:hypothetical protein
MLLPTVQQARQAKVTQVAMEVVLGLMELLAAAAAQAQSEELPQFLLRVMAAQALHQAFLAQA